MTYAWIGRQALAQYGYEEIIRRGVEAGFLRYPDSERTKTQNLVGQTMADAAREAWPVFTEWALAAGITSQVDSLAPGPMDVVALGMLVVGLGSAAFVGVRVLTTSTTATATPVPTATPIPTTTAIPTATATTTTTAPPIAVPRKKPKDECLDKYVACMDSPLGNLVVDKHGSTLCETCRNICKEKNGGEWPWGVELTRRWQSCT